MQQKELLMSRRPFVPRCSVCSRLNHNTVDCPKIHLPKRNVNFLLAKTSSNFFDIASGRRKKARSGKRLSWKNYYSFQEQRAVNYNRYQLKSNEFNGFLPPRMSTSLKEVDLGKKKSFIYAIPSSQMICQQGSDKCLLASAKKLSTYHDLRPEYLSNKAIAWGQKNAEKFYDSILWEQEYFPQNHIKVILTSISKFSHTHRIKI